VTNCLRVGGAQSGRQQTTTSETTRRPASSLAAYSFKMESDKPPRGIHALLVLALIRNLDDDRV
jgi:hypothetical protein